MRKHFKKLSAIAMALVMTVTMLVLIPPTQQTYGLANTNPDAVGVTVNGQWITFPDQQPVIVNDRLLVPAGGVFTAMGFTPHWDNVERIARLTRSDMTIIIPADGVAFVVSRATGTTTITPPVAQRIINGRIMLPVGAITDAVGGTHSWNNVNRVAHIIVPAVPTPTPTATPTPTPTPTPTATPLPTTPTPLLVGAPRFEGSTGFATGGNAVMLGNTYANAIWGGGWSHHNLANRFDTLSVRLGRFDGSGSLGRSVRFIGDGRNLLTFEVAGAHFVPINIVIDVRGVSILRIEIDEPGVNGVSVVIANAILNPAGPATPTPVPTPTPTPVPFLQAAPRFEGTVGFATGGNAVMLGQTYANAIWGGGWSHHNLANQYSSLTARIGRFDGSGAGARTIRFTGDGRYLASFTVEGSTFIPLNVTVDVRGVSILRIEIDEPYPNGVSVVMGNAMLR